MLHSNEIISHRVRTLLALRVCSLSGICMSNVEVSLSVHIEVSVQCKADLFHIHNFTHSAPVQSKTQQCCTNPDKYTEMMLQLKSRASQAGTNTNVNILLWLFLKLKK